MKKTLLIIVLIIAGTALASLVQREVWDGGFLQAEYRVSIFDENSHPLKNVQLKVLDSRGNTSFGYPVTDFMEDSIPMSDENGMMVFHHVGLAHEFGGSCSRLFFMFPVGNCDAPHYTLRFFLAGRLVASLGYTYLEDLGIKTGLTTLPTVKRRWDQKTPSPLSLPEHLHIENRSIPSHLDFYVITKTLIVSQ